MFIIFCLCKVSYARFSSEIAWLFSLHCPLCWFAVTYYYWYNWKDSSFWCPHPKVNIWFGKIIITKNIYDLLSTSLSHFLFILCHLGPIFRYISHKDGSYRAALIGVTYFVLLKFLPSFRAIGLRLRISGENVGFFSFAPMYLYNFVRITYYFRI